LSKGNYFPLTIILRHAKHLKMRKTFSVNHFMAKQTEPKFRENGWIFAVSALKCKIFIESTSNKHPMPILFFKYKKNLKKKKKKHKKSHAATSLNIENGIVLPNVLGSTFASL
jgi:hypothetical protein